MIDTLMPQKYWWLNFMSQKNNGHWQLNFYTPIILVIDNGSYDAPKMLRIHKRWPENIGDWQLLLHSKNIGDWQQIL